MEEEKLSQKQTKRREKVIEYIYKSHNNRPLSIDISSTDIVLLEKKGKLNRTIINFYLRYLEQEIIKEDIRSKIYVYNTYFYDDIRKIYKLDEPNRFRQSGNIKIWTANIDIFSKDYLVIPIYNKVHCLLALICHPNAVFENAINFVKSNYTFVPEKTTHLIILTSTNEDVEEIIKSIKFYINLQYAYRMTNDVKPIFKDYDGYDNMFKTWIVMVKVSMKIDANK